MTSDSWIPLERFPAAHAGGLALFVDLAAAVGRAPAHLKASLVPVLAVEINVAALDDFVAALADRFSHGSAALGVTTKEPHDSFEWAAGFLRADVVATLVVLVPQASAGVLLLVTVLDQADPLTVALVLRHDVPSQLNVVAIQPESTSIPICGSVCGHIGLMQNLVRRGLPVDSGPFGGKGECLTAFARVVAKSPGWVAI